MNGKANPYIDESEDLELGFLLLRMRILSYNPIRFKLIIKTNPKNKEIKKTFKEILFEEINIIKEIINDKEEMQDGINIFIIH